MAVKNIDPTLLAMAQDFVDTKLGVPAQDRQDPEFPVAAFREELAREFATFHMTMVVVGEVVRNRQ